PVVGVHPAAGTLLVRRPARGACFGGTFRRGRTFPSGRVLRRLLLGRGLTGAFGAALGAIRRIETIIGGGDIDLTITDRHPRRLQALLLFGDRHRGPRDLQSVVVVHHIVRTREGERA